MKNTVFIVSGEESGDIHGAGLILELKKLRPALRVGGMGGERMRRAGLVGLDSRSVSVVGITEVIGKLAVIKRAFDELKRRLERERPDCVVLIDFPDFNFRVARAARGLGIPVIYYISPQVWAWRKGRVKTLAELVDKMLVVFPFEEAIYAEAGVDVEYVGHPLTDVVECTLSPGEARDALGLPAGRAVVSLLPGSRSGEVKRMLRPMLRAAEMVDAGLKEAGRRASFLIPAAASVDDRDLEKPLLKCRADVRVIRDKLYTALRASDAALVTSGTATLETALVGTPIVIAYKMSGLSYLIGKALIGMEHVGLPNIVAGREVVPELLQSSANPRRMAEEVTRLLRDGEARAAMTEGFEEIRKKLGSGGASRRAARAVSYFIGEA